METIKEQVIKDFQDGLSPKEIIQKRGYAKSTVYDAVSKFLKPKLKFSKALILRKNSWELIAETNEQWIFTKRN